jgi:hypothetical protein
MVTSTSVFSGAACSPSLAATAANSAAIAQAQNNAAQYYLAPANAIAAAGWDRC